MEAEPPSEYHRKFLWANGIEEKHSDAGQPTFELSKSYIAREPPLQGKRRVPPPGGVELPGTSAPPGGRGDYVVLGDNQTRWHGRGQPGVPAPKTEYALKGEPKEDEGGGFDQSLRKKLEKKYSDRVQPVKASKPRNNDAEKRVRNDAGDARHRSEAADTRHRSDAIDARHRSDAGDARHRSDAIDARHHSDAGDARHRSDTADARHHSDAAMRHHRRCKSGKSGEERYSKKRPNSAKDFAHPAGLPSAIDSSSPEVKSLKTKDKRWKSAENLNLNVESSMNAEKFYGGSIDLKHSDAGFRSVSSEYAKKYGWHPSKAYLSTSNAGIGSIPPEGPDLGYDHQPKIMQPSQKMSKRNVKKMYTTEYHGKFKPAVEKHDGGDGGRNWVSDVTGLREAAAAYRRRFKADNFSKSHSLQLDSNVAELWEPKFQSDEEAGGRRRRRRSDRVRSASVPPRASTPPPPTPPPPSHPAGVPGMRPSPARGPGSRPPAPGPGLGPDLGRIPSPRAVELGMKQRHHLDRTTPIPAFVSKLDLDSDSSSGRCDCGASLRSETTSSDSSRANRGNGISNVKTKDRERKKILKPNFVPSTIPEKMGLTYKVEKHSPDGTSSTSSASTAGSIRDSRRRRQEE